MTMPFKKSHSTITMLAVLLTTVALIFTPINGYGAARTFNERFSTNANGDIRLIGNTIMTCPSLDSTCAGTQNGTLTNDNSKFNMVYVQDDATTPGLSSSSSATISLPAGSTVLWAGLYWGGDYPAPLPTTVKLRTPASGGYIDITATQQDQNLGNQATAYSAFTDITGYVAAGMSGKYTVANVASTTNVKGGYGGWGIAVVFSNSTLPLRNLVVYDGFDYIANNSSLTINLSGFTTPLNGPVATNVGFLAGN